MIPLVVLDLDGTLIGSEGQVLPCVWPAVEKLQAAGVKLAACTGRPNTGVARKAAQRLGPRNPHVFQSGALVTYPDGNALHVAALKEATTRQLIEHSRELGLILELYTPTTMFVERKTPLGEQHAKMIGVNAIVSDLLSVAQSEPVVRAQWLIPLQRRSEVESLPLDGVQLSPATAPGMPGTLFVSITREGVSKGSAVRQLAEAMKVPLSSVLAIGDSEGDAPMLDLVGYPVVMGNAPESLRQRYPNVAGLVDECGVVPALEEALRLRPPQGAA